MCISQSSGQVKVRVTCNESGGWVEVRMRVESYARC